MKNKKLVGVLLAGIMTVSAVATPAAITKLGVEEPPAIVTTMEASAKTAVKTGRFNYKKGSLKNGNNFLWSGYTTIHVNNKNQKTRIKFCTFDRYGVASGGTYDIEFRAPNGKLLDSKTVSMSSLCTVKTGYSYFKVRIRTHSYGKKSWQQVRNLTNATKCHYWSIDATSNCHF